MSRLPRPVALEALQRELAELRGRVECLEAAALPDDRWLPIVARAVGDHVFSARELVAHAAADPDLRRAVAGQSIRQIGARLKRILRSPVPGFALRVAARDEDGCIWAISQDDACPPTGTGF
jgi:hypothetical protein